MAAGHDQHDGEQAGDGQGVAREPRLAQPPAARHGMRVEVLRDAIRIDDRDQAVEQRNEVEDEDRAQQERAEQQPDELQAVHPQHEAGEERDQQDWRGREPEGPRVGAQIEVPEAREEERKERRSERRPGARSRLLRFLHRA